MGNDNSKRSTGRPIKSRTAKRPANRKAKAEEIETIEPVHEVIEIPVALIEIRESIHNLAELDLETFQDKHSVFKIKNGLFEIEEVVKSCIQAIKTEGLKQMGLDTIDLRLLSEAVNHWMGTMGQAGALTDRDGTAMTFLIRGLEILMEGNGPESKMVGTVNFKEVIDRNMENAKHLVPGPIDEE